jgi:alpha-beta hydrolase superfamily lysophospholipase
MLINNNLFYIKTHEVEQPKATVIITHGIAEHSGRYSALVDALNKASFRVVRYDLRGHGQSGGARGKLKSYKQMIEDLHEIVKIEKKANNTPIYLLGHSMGGLIVDMYGVTYDDVAGIISSAAASYFVSDVKPFRFIGYKWLGWVRVKTNFADNRLSSIHEVEVRYQNDPLNLKHFYVSLVGNMMISGVRYLNKNLNRFKAPLLVLHGGKDVIVPTAYSHRFFDLVHAGDKSIKIYEESLHEILNDVEQEQVRKDIITWLNERI